METELMPNWLEKRVQLSPNRRAIITGDSDWTFAQLYEESVKMAGRLTTLGISKGDHVAILMNNQKEFISLIHGIELVGAVAVLLNTKLTVNELAFQLNDSQSKFLIYNECFKDRIEQEWPESSSMTTENLIKVNEIPFVAKNEWDLKALHTIIYTSGTTGRPKGVMLSYGNHWWSAVSSSLNLGLHMDDCWLLSLPLFHVSGLSMLMKNIIYGVPIVLHEKFDPNKVNQAIIKHKVTMISVVSQMLYQMVDALDDENYPSYFRCALLGGGPAPLSLLEKCKHKGVPVIQSYGMTETSSQIVTLSSEYMLEKLGSAGKPLFPAQLRIESERTIVKQGEIGEIVVKGPNVTKGYWHREAETRNAINDGWLHTGDIGYVDEDGFLFVLDRRSDLIISGGENIYPAEIESILLAHPDVAEAGVTGIDDEKWGQVPIAFIKKYDKASVTVEELMNYCIEQLAKYKVPTQIYFVNELPRNAANKLMRHKLKELL